MSLTSVGHLAQCWRSISCIVLFFVLFALFLPISQYIVISTILRDGHSFACYSPNGILLKWRHSVEKQYWQEYYQQHGKQLHLTHTYIQSFGAGTPATGQYIPAPRGYIGLTSNVLMDEINWVVSNNMQGVIYNQEFYLPIYQQVVDYTTVTIKVKRLSWIQRQLIDKCQGEMS